MVSNYDYKLNKLRRELQILNNNTSPDFYNQDLEQNKREVLQQIRQLENRKERRNELSDYQY